MNRGVTETDQGYGRISRTRPISVPREEIAFSQEMLFVYEGVLFEEFVQIRVSAGELVQREGEVEGLQCPLSKEEPISFPA
jgi:hypothetical protein